MSLAGDAVPEGRPQESDPTPIWPGARPLDGGPGATAWGSVLEYCRRTRRSAYTLALVVPFLAAYEIGLLALRLSGEDFNTRNGADAVIRYILFPLGLQSAGTVGAVLWSVVSALVLAVCYLGWRAYQGPAPPGEPFRRRYVGWLFVESAGWALVLFLVSAVFFGRVVRGEGGRAAADAGGWPVLAEFVFNAGAGVYEEFVFRVILVTVLALFFRRVVHLERVPGGVAAAVAAAVLFSLMHFGSGPGADPWGGELFWPLFMFRAAAGLFFSLLFCFRSFGVAVAAHAMYDNLVTILS